MLRQLFAPQLVALYILSGTTIYVHFRGKQRLRFARQLGDHSTYLAPYNVLMYAGSAVPNKPVIPTEQFPELQKLTDNWEMIRDEARLLFEGFHSCGRRQQRLGLLLVPQERLEALLSEMVR